MTVPAARVIDFFRNLAKRQEAEGKARVAMYQEVGRVIVTLSEVEEVLAEIYVFLNQPTPDDVSAKRFRDSQSIPAKIKLVDDAVDRSPLVKDKLRWKKLSERVFTHKAARNIAAHSSIEFHFEDGSEDFKIALGTQLHHTHPREELYLSDVKASADELHDIRVGMHRFLRRLIYSE